YVAMTRAKNKLSIVSFYHPVKTRNGIFNIAQREKDLKFSRSVHLSINNTLEELIIALLRISKAADLKEEMGVVDSGYIESVSNFAGFNFEYINNEDVDIFETIRDFDSDDVETVHLNVEGFDINGNPIFPEYKYEKSVNAASKTSVSEMKREELKLSLDTVDEKERRRLPINLIVPKPEYYDPKNTYSSASSKGTLIHNLLHFFDFPSMLEAMESGRNANEALKLELDYLKERGVIKDNMIPVVESFEKELSSFLVSDLFKRITKAEIADKAYFEQPIMFSIGVKDTDDDTLVQGVIDVMFMEGDEAVIVDYKTDRIGSDDDTEIKKILEEKHKLQLDLYAASVEASGIKVKEKIIWLVRKGREFVL
ncbi:MAG: PD-(D/E)XK nuclease family protein, partial [Clostridiales bacterium]|nr:PD-(D/E)XK nuclease family protein [Clostridiales bacterium]